MWTPRRVLLLAGGFALFFSVYVVYAHFLAGIDGLPPLPQDYLPIADATPAPIKEPSPHSTSNSADQKLIKAFGPDCREAKEFKIKLELQAKGVVIAARDFAIEDGRVKLWPFSAAVFGKSRGPDGPGKCEEINTVQAREAYITFDKPVKNITEMTSRKITGGTLTGDIYVLNNRSTTQRDDDLSLFTQGPLYYDEAQHLIWTDQTVRMTDPQSKPKPMTVDGTRLYIYLTPDSKPETSSAAAPRKPAGPSISGVDRIVLGRDVEMNLWVDSQSGFLGEGKGAATKPSRTKLDAVNIPGAGMAKKGADSTPPTQPEKSKVVIMTQGPFCYDLRTDRAVFDILKQGGPRPNVVTVDRLNEGEGKVDHLQCDRLEIQFRRNHAAGAPGAASPTPAGQEGSEGLDIENVRATGQEVVLTSDAEVLEAHGNDFFFDKLTHLSILKGNPKMWALKEGNEIEAPELQLVDVKNAQQATAVGEGTIRILDKPTGKRPLQAQWRQRLIYAKEGPYDLLTLVGDAAFVDYEHGQKLSADVLKVWLEPSDEPVSAGEQQRRKPHHLDAVGHVTTAGPDLHVHDAEKVTIWFRDVPPSADPQAETLPALSAAGNEQPARPAAVNAPMSPIASASSVAPAAAPEGTAAAKPKKPMDLTARLVSAHVIRTGSKNDLEKLWCEGKVRVFQEPATPEDKGVDISGDTLELTHHVDGNILAVTGDHAQVMMEKLFIFGPEIHIDQPANEAWVNGMGVMRMPSNANFDGSKLSKPSELTINWERKMIFNGQEANFWGSIRAQQDNGHLACQWMQATLDRKVSLREGEKGRQPAQVQKLICDKEVWIEQGTLEGTRVVASKRIDCQELSIDNDKENEDSEALATGPGIVRIFQVGTGEELVPGQSGSPSVAAPTAANRNTGSGGTNKPKQQEKPQEELTQVRFQGKMVAKKGLGMATFFDNVIVWHVPTADPDLKIDENHPPKGATILSCQKLEVLNHKYANGKTSQEMRAYHKVIIEGEDFSGNAEVVKYDQSKEQIILEAGEGNLAVLYKEKAPGLDREKISGKKIIYFRLTGDFQVEGAREIRVNK